jgi:betaine-aldehyde dehydrogenase
VSTAAVPDGATAETIAVRRPSDGGEIASVTVASPADVARVAARLRVAQPAWEAIGVKGRARWMAALRDWMLDNRARLADLVQEETGKVRAEAESEVPSLAAGINYWCSHAAGFLAEETPRASFPLMKTKKLRVVHRPHQVVGVISPWNLPLLLSFDDAFAALFAGAAVAVKPSELTPLAVSEVVRGWQEEVGGPDVLAVVNGAGATGEALVDACDFIQFTGSTRTGKAVMRRAAETLTPVSLELGGKDPMIVLEGANLERAVNAAAWGALANAGQVCMGIERVYVEAPIYDEFLGRLTETVSALKQGTDERSYGADIGAMTSPAQVETVEAHVADARDKGARVLTGGSRREGPGDFYEPTVLADVDHTMAVMQEETFGPVVPVMKVANATEAVRLANDSPYGLSATVFAGDRAQAVRLARALQVGAVNVNDVFTNVYVMDVPMAGWKGSGMGGRHGKDGIRKFCRPQAIVASRVKEPKAEALWFPYATSKRAFATRLFHFFVARGWRNRLGR